MNQIKHLTSRRLLLALFLFQLLLPAEAIQISEKAVISLLTCDPSGDEAHQLYGHTALRVQDTIVTPEGDETLDIIFNYGIFDFSKPHFIYRFAKGETDYMLGINDAESFLAYYQMRGSGVFAQQLNLRPAEKMRLFDALMTNAQPENRIYRYNFFFDNCATRPNAMIEQVIEGTILYPDTMAPKSFREMINHCTRDHPWITFGCDLIIGMPADRHVTRKESFFIPVYLEEAYADATLLDSQGEHRPLISATQCLVARTEKEEVAPPFFTPLKSTLLFLLLVVTLTFVGWRKRWSLRWFDCLLFFAAGVAGCIVFFLSFISVHPAMWPNISLAWLHPLHLIAVVLIAVKKLNFAAYFYHFINFAVLFMLLAGWCFIPQHLNIAFIPLIISLMIRSGAGILNKKRGE